MKNFTWGLVIPLLLFVSCVQDDDFSIPDTVDPDPAAGVEVQDFMWKAMNFWYFWQEDVENLSDSRFPDTPEGSAAYTEFLQSESEPGAFFDNQLLFSEDRFSFYSDDYVTLTQSLSGITKSNGLIFGLSRIQGSNEVLDMYSISLKIQMLPPNPSKEAIFSSPSTEPL